jgi:hypothetical protein
MIDKSVIKGTLEIELIRKDGSVKRWTEKNLVTQYGDQFYAEKAVGIGSHNAVSGMKLGTGDEAVAKTGAGAALETYLSGSNVAIADTYPQSSTSSGSRRITWRSEWPAGVATNSAISEIVLVNQGTLSDATSAAGETIARALFNSPVDKGADDLLRVNWHHDFLGDNS